MKRFILFLAFTIGMAQIANAATFSDVNEDHKYFTAVESLYNLEIVNGYPDGSFGPDKAVNRAEALKMILNSAEIGSAEIEDGDGVDFSDVGLDDWFAKFVLSGVERGIVNGNPDGTFAPARQVNKAEFLKMLLESFDIDLSKHQGLEEGVSADSSVEDWFLPYLSYSKTVGITTPSLNNMLEPGKMLTRGECAEIIYKMLVLERGGDAQKLLNIAESSLVDVIIYLSENNVQKAIDNADRAVFYTDRALEVAGDDSVALGANKIAHGFRSLCLAYQAGVEGDNQGVVSYVTEAKNFALEAYNFSISFLSLKTEIEAVGDVLLDQVELTEAVE